MPAPPKVPDPKPARAKSEGRKPWKKKTPVEIVFEQAEKLKAEIAEAEEEIKAKRKQLLEIRRSQEAVRRDVTTVPLLLPDPSRLPPIHAQEAEEEPWIFARYFLPGTNLAWY